MFLPTTKTALINEIYYIWQGHYKHYEIERVYNEIYYKDINRHKYYRHKAGIKRLQAFLIQSRNDIKKMDGEIKKLKYNIVANNSEK